MPPLNPGVRIRPVERADFAAWKPLWDGYNAFYGREGSTALPDAITQSTWKRFFDPDEPVHALLAEHDGRVVGLTHFLYHRSTTRIERTCYLQDLFTVPEMRGHGIARALILGVYQTARDAGLHEVYWQTHVSNAAGRLLYDKVATHSGYIVYEKEV